MRRAISKTVSIFGPVNGRPVESVYWFRPLTVIFLPVYNAEAEFAESVMNESSEWV